MTQLPQQLSSLSLREDEQTCIFTSAVECSGVGLTDSCWQVHERLPFYSADRVIALSHCIWVYFQTHV